MSELQRLFCYRYKDGLASKFTGQSNGHKIIVTLVISFAQCQSQGPSSAILAIQSNGLNITIHGPFSLVFYSGPIPEKLSEVNQGDPTSGEAR